MFWTLLFGLFVPFVSLGCNYINPVNVYYRYEL